MIANLKCLENFPKNSILIQRIECKPIFWNYEQFYQALGISDNVLVYVTQLNAQFISLED